MQAVSLIGLLIYLFATGSIGLRLLRLWWRTRLLPELTMSTAYLSGGTLGWTLVLAGHAPPIIHTPTGLIIRTAALFFLSVGALALIVGTWRIYRPERTWIGFLCAALALILLTDFIRNAVLNATPFVRADNAWYWPGALGRAFAFVWSTYESLRYYGLLKRRLRLGMVEPIIVNRLFLWSISGVMTCTICILAVAGTILNIDFTYADFFLATYAFLGVIGALAIWLGFFPPQRYVRFIEARAANGAR